jgi:glycosyltransferase involved in cell wall biosynthesis
VNSYTILAPSLSRGGAESMAYKYGRYLISRGHDVTFLLLEDRIDKRYRDVESEIIGAGSLKSSFFKLLFYKGDNERTHISLIPFYTFLFQITRFLRMDFGYKYIYTVHNNLDQDLPKKGIHALVRIWYLISLRKSRNVYAVCRELALELNRLDIRCSTISNVTDWKFDPTLGKRQVQDPMNIVMVGRLDYQKDYDYAFKFFESLVDNGIQFSVDIYGEGPEKNHIESIVKDKANLDVTVKGYSDDLENLLHDEKYGVLLLSSRYEGFGLVLIEALYKGIFPVSRDCDFGPREIISHGVGHLLPYEFKSDAVQGFIQVMKEWSSYSEEERLIRINEAKCKIEASIGDEWAQLESLQ